MRRAFMVQLLVAAPIIGFVTGICRDRFAWFKPRLSEVGGR